MTLARRLEPVVFLAGGATLAIEIAASRLLAPYFGSSTVVWANIIGLTLAYLSLGYWLGGRIADRRPESGLLARIILLAAAALAITPFAARPILDLAVRGLDALSLGSVVGSFFAALALFAVPITALGAVAPFAIRLALSTSPTRARLPGACTPSPPSGVSSARSSQRWWRFRSWERSARSSVRPPSLRSPPRFWPVRAGWSRPSLQLHCSHSRPGT